MLNEREVLRLAKLIVNPRNEPISAFQYGAYEMMVELAKDEARVLLRRKLCYQRDLLVGGTP